MFDMLIESKPKKERTIGQTAISVVFHVIVIFAAVKATQGAAETVKKIVASETMAFLAPPPPPEPEPPPPDAVAQKSAPPQGFQTIVPPREIPTSIPPINLSEKFNAKDFSGKGIEGGISTGVLGGTGPVITGESFTVDQVDDPVQYIGGPLPTYPPALRTAGIEGRVTVRYIVGADGKVEESTIQVLNSTNKAFEAPAIEAIRKSNFKPAKIKGSPVRQLVEQVVRFTIG